MIRKIINKDKIKSSLVSTAGQLIRTPKSPDEQLGQLFSDVQKQQIFGDGKTFVDLVPRFRTKTIAQKYQLQKQDATFDLAKFVSHHFYEISTLQQKPGFVSDHNQPIGEHISRLWHELERRNRVDRGSLIALPYPYIVPGGRFNEQFYWDSYFIMLGLAVDDRWDSIEHIIKNAAYMMRKFGFIPTANRTYFLSRSQPPFFSLMVKLLATHKGSATLAEYLPYLLKEYRFWMKGSSKLKQQEHRAFARVVQMDNGALLNRYYDNKMTPRPESLYEDTGTAESVHERDADRLYLHLRAGAESGWDFSSRWFSDPHDMSSIHTADIIPVDLNCLLYQLEITIVETYQYLKQPLLARKFQRLADKRAAAIATYCWDEALGFFMDYNFHHHTRTANMTLAGVFPLFVGIATADQASKVANHIEHQFLKKGGLMTTLTQNDQQWDGSNGWAPLHYVVIQGLRRYGYDDLANKIKRRWIRTNINVYKTHYKLIEKYNVTSNDGIGGGGEYQLQDGFGWTNGVLQALMSENT